MPRIDYDSFRARSWTERVSIFNTISAEERADLVRTHLSKWLSRHRHELTDAQIGIIEEIIAFISTDLYAFPRNEELISGFMDLARRAALLLSREQVRDALIMHWEPPSATVDT